MQPSVAGRRVERVRHEVRRRLARVRRVEPLGPGFVAVTFAGAELAGFVSPSFDDHVKFVFDAGAAGPVRRDYTPRRFDAGAGELTIEFALHGDGPASRWARAATVGLGAVIAGPRSSMVVATDLDWHLLAGDASALPAVHRRLEELPAGARAIVVLDVAPADRRRFASDAQVDLRWVEGAEALISTVRTALPGRGAEGFVWAAGEASAMARLRGVLLDELRLPKEAVRVAAYWKRGAAAHHEVLDAAASAQP